MRKGPDQKGGMRDRPGATRQSSAELAVPAPSSLARAAAPSLVPPLPCRFTKAAGARFSKRALAEFIFRCECAGCRDAVTAAIAGDRPERLELVDRWELLTAPGLTFGAL